MPLSSQTTRTGLSRHYSRPSGGRHRRGSKLPLAVLTVGVVGAIAGGSWFLSDGGEAAVGSPAAAHASTPQAAAAAPPTAAAAGHSAPAPAAQPAPPQQRQQQPAVPTMSLGTPQPLASPPVATRVAPAQPAAQPADAPAYDPDATALAGGSAVVREGMDLIADGRLIEGRRVLSDLLFNRSQSLTPADAQTVRDTLASINKELVFSPKIFPGDPIVQAYRVQPGDMLARIAANADVPYPFLELINRIDARRLQAGQTIKVVKGPFHARVAKSEYRMDLYLVDESGAKIYVTSLPVGLGEADSTPLGKWVIEPGRKVKNPAWANPRTGERYAADDPNNPIGEYWLALKGVDAATEGLRGYGIHGTNEPQSVGQQMSMGCVRLRDADIELVYQMLDEGDSTVEIVR